MQTDRPKSYIQKWIIKIENLYFILNKPDLIQIDIICGTQFKDLTQK